MSERVPSKQLKRAAGRIDANTLIDLFSSAIQPCTPLSGHEKLLREEVAKRQKGGGLNPKQIQRLKSLQQYDGGFDF